MPRKQKKMVNLEVDETSAVDHPAHKAEGWVVVKSADSDSLLGALEELMTDKENKMTTEITEQKVDKMKYTDLDKANKKIAEMEAEMEKMGHEMKNMKKIGHDKDKDEKEMMKSADPIIQELFAKAQAEAETLRKELAEANEEKIQKSFLEKAAKWSNLNQKAEELGTMLRKVAAVDEALVAQIETMLDALNAQAESAEIFTELGTAKSATGNGSAFEKVQSLAKAAVEQAVSGLIMRSPSLYAEYLAETR
jgi:hypothetical protein